MDELLLLVFLMREEIAVVRFLEEQILEGIVIFRTYLIGFHHMVVDICLGISEKLVRQILVGRKLVDFYLTDVPGAVRLNTAYCLLIKLNELSTQRIFQLIFFRYCSISVFSSGQGRKVPLSLTMNARFLSSETSRLL